MRRGCSSLFLPAVGLLVMATGCTSESEREAAPVPAPAVSSGASRVDVEPAPTGTKASVAIGGGRSALTAKQAVLTIVTTSDCEFEIDSVRVKDSTLHVESRSSEQRCGVVGRDRQRDDVVFASNLLQRTAMKGSLILRTPDGQLLSVPVQIGIT